MLKLIKAPDNVVAVQLSWIAIGENLRFLRERVAKALAEHDRIGLVVDFAGLTDVASDALLDGARSDADLLEGLDRVARCALLSDKEWPAAAIVYASPFLPGVELKAFPAGAFDGAVAWAADFAKAPAANGSAFCSLPTRQEAAMAFEIEGAAAIDKAARSPWRTASPQ